MLTLCNKNIARVLLSGRLHIFNGSPDNILKPVAAVSSQWSNSIGYCYRILTDCSIVFPLNYLAAELHLYCFWLALGLQLSCFRVANALRDVSFCSNKYPLWFLLSLQGFVCCFALIVDFCACCAKFVFWFRVLCDFCGLSDVLIYYFDLLIFSGLPLLVVIAPLGCFYHYLGYVYFPQLIN